MPVIFLITIHNLQVTNSFIYFLENIRVFKKRKKVVLNANDRDS